MLLRQTVVIAAVLATTLAAPVAQAADLCSTIKAAIKVGKTDKQFVSLQTTPLNGRESTNFDLVDTPSKLTVPDMNCEISLEGGRGYHSCSRQPVDGSLYAPYLVIQVQRCLGKAPDPDSSATNTIFTVRQSEAGRLSQQKQAPGLSERGGLVNASAGGYLRPVLIATFVVLSGGDFPPQCLL